MPTPSTCNNTKYDQVIIDIVDYVTQQPVISELAYETAYYCF